MKRRELKQLIRECYREILNEYEHYQSQISRKLRGAWKERNPEKIVYYQQAQGMSDVTDWNKFKESWAYSEWKNKHLSDIDNIINKLEKTSYYMEEDIGTEPYDNETDTFAPGPRDRLEGEEDYLGIPEYPHSIIKKHNMDGEPRWFVYSNESPVALIIGWGKSSLDAIKNAKTTAKYIKQGGVGHTGELR